MFVREPIVAGMFYNLNRENLMKQIESCFKHPLGPGEMKEEEFIAAVVPHAGYMYSGPIAAWVYAKIPKANYIIIGPNHNLIGSGFAVFGKGTWKTPLGNVEVNDKLALRLVRENPLLEFDIVAHQNEHSIEVQLPFLQYRFGDNFEIVPISIINQFPTMEFLEQCQAIGKTIAKALKDEKNWMILASSDFTHYEPYEYAMMTDKYFIEAIEKLDEKEFFLRLQEKHGSVCGFGAIAIAMTIAKELGAKNGKLLKYATSGDITGDKTAVVGYASIVMR